MINPFLIFFYNWTDFNNERIILFRGKGGGEEVTNTNIGIEIPNVSVHLTADFVRGQSLLAERLSYTFFPGRSNGPSTTACLVNTVAPFLQVFGPPTSHNFRVDVYEIVCLLW